MKKTIIRSLIILLISVNSLLSENISEKLIYQLRGHYCIDHILKYPQHSWHIGKLSVPLDGYLTEANAVTIDYKIVSNGDTFESNIKIKPTGISDYEWKINPLYTKGAITKVVYPSSEKELLLSGMAVLPENLGVNSEGILHIIKNSNGYADLETNINACLSKDPKKAIVGWLGIRSRPSLSGAVLSALLQKTDKSLQLVALTLILNKNSKIPPKEIKSLVEHVDNSTKVILARGILTSYFFDEWESKDRLCDIAGKKLVEKIPNKPENEIFAYLKDIYRIKK